MIDERKYPMPAAINRADEWTARKIENAKLEIPSTYRQPVRSRLVEMIRALNSAAAFQLSGRLFTRANIDAILDARDSLIR